MASSEKVLHIHYNAAIFGTLGTAGLLLGPLLFDHAQHSPAFYQRHLTWLYSIAALLTLFGLVCVLLIILLYSDERLVQPNSVNDHLQQVLNASGRSNTHETGILTGIGAFVAFYGFLWLSLYVIRYKLMVRKTVSSKFKALIPKKNPYLPLFALFTGLVLISAGMSSDSNAVHEFNEKRFVMAMIGSIGITLSMWGIAKQYKNVDSMYEHYMSGFWSLYVFSLFVFMSSAVFVDS